MPRAILLVMDSFGIGHAPDAAKFGDEGANTLGHIAQACAAGKANGEGLREGPLKVPFLEGLGLGHAAHIAGGEFPAGFSPTVQPRGRCGAACEVSSGKDTISGHWEIAGLPVLFDWGYFTKAENSFPEPLIADIIAKGKVPGILGNCQASGTEIIFRLGAEHVRTGKPICYTSADSVFQIAAHEQHFGLDRLYDLCQIVRKLVDPLNVGRVIARPFIGDEGKGFTRTGNRRDYAIPPTGTTLLDEVTRAGNIVHAVGKVSDIFAGNGVGRKVYASGHDMLMAETLKSVDEAGDGDLIFTNFVDFDMLYGHPRDVAGYANALEKFDAALPALFDRLRKGDMVVLTADHGNDPTWRGTDHTREQIPIMVFGPDLAPGLLQPATTFADIGATIAAHLGLPALTAGSPLVLAD